MATRDLRTMGTLTVDCRADVADGPVQIEVRKANLALVGVTAPSQPIDVPAGTYHVRGVSASGLELLGEVDVVAGQPATLTLAPDESEAPVRNAPPARKARGVQSRALGAAPDVGTADVEATMTTPALPGVDLRTFTGNVLMGQGTPTPTPAAHEIPAAEPATRRFVIHAGLTSAVQIFLAGRIMNMVPAASPRHACTLAIRQQADGIACGFELSRDAGVFFSAYTSGQLDTATMANKAGFDRSAPALREMAEDLLEDKLDDPMGAIVSALGLLRMGELDTLGEWTGKLTRGLPWSPDAVCVRGEHLARNGDHYQALELFLMLGERGLPVFADSLSYALNRLRSYRRVKDLASREAEVADLILRLQRFAAASDLKSAFVIYTAADPNDPGRL